MRRLALLAAYTAIVLFRAGPASGADAAAVRRNDRSIVTSWAAISEVLILPTEALRGAQVSPPRAD
jgi:hypothetical protein